MKSKLQLILLCAGLLVFGSPAVHVCRIVFAGNTLTVSDAASAAEKVPSLDLWDNLRSTLISDRGRRRRI